MPILQKNNSIFFSLFAIVWIVSAYFSLTITKGQELLTIADYRTTVGDFIFPIITLLGEAYVYIIAALIFFIQKKNLQGLTVGILGTGSALISYGAKNWFAAPRPQVYFREILQRPELISQIEGVELANSFTSSFPSGHTLAAFAFYTFIALQQRELWLKIVLLLTAIAVGFSRMYLFQHFITDVTWGALIGLIWALVVNTSHHKLAINKR